MKHFLRALVVVIVVGHYANAALLSVNTSSRQDSLAAYYNLYAPTTYVPTGWTTTGLSDPGTTSAAFQNAVITRVNYYRTMAGVPAITHNATYTQRAQAAAHLISANNRSSHNPTSDWLYYTTTALQGAQRSNLYLGSSGIAAIDGYMRGPGSTNFSVGHRRWVLNPPAKQFGVGDVSATTGRAQANALYVVDVASNAPHPATRDGYVAWPPPGYVPYNVVFPRWHFSKQGVDFSAATVSLTLGGLTVPAAVIARGTENLMGYLSFNVNNLSDFATFPKPTADQRYRVTIQNARVNGVAQTFSYNVTLFDPVTIAGDYNFDGVVNAADYTTIRDGLGTRYTQADLATWRASYGDRASTTAVAVPEPSGLGLALLAAAAAAPARRRTATGPASRA